MVENAKKNYGKTSISSSNDGSDSDFVDFEEVE